jgi:predicted dehydrogenase
VAEESAKGIPEEIINGFYDEAAALLRAISRGEPLRPSIEDVYPSVELCMALANAAGKIATVAL